MKRIVVVVLGATLILLLGAALYVGSQCPCERVPGIALWGEEQSAPIDDWSFANETPLCQLQVTGGVVPQAINLNCMSGDGDLFVSCSQCDGKRWSSMAQSHPNGRIQISGKVYPITLERLTDTTVLNRSWAARKAKLEVFGRRASPERPDHWWSFQLTSR